MSIFISTILVLFYATVITVTTLDPFQNAAVFMVVNVWAAANAIMLSRGKK